ncbi:anthranilate synthase component II [Halomicrococcus gelatinilyticus]|uniref:anthranilate synthase component II n=1 Tax=Halomicrococcus gelatinilyticus TaxID=1702103 RepID=UPI002E154F20
MTRVTFVDNFDSFTYNLVEYVSERAETTVLKNTASLADVRDTDPDAVVVSPGPGHPKNERDVGVTLDVFRELATEVPTFGVCLGLEAAVYAYGGTVGRAPEPVHGKAFPVDHDGRGVFAGIEQGFRAGRYHSLVATEVPDCFAVTATTTHAVGDDTTEGSTGGEHDGGAAGEEELVMGVRHREHPIECVQFHPESVLTAHGRDVVANFVDGVEAGTVRDGATPTTR